MPEAMMTHQLDGADERLNVTFYPKELPDAVQTLAQGRPMVKTVIHMRLIQPGDARLATHDQPARPEDIRRFPRQWADFQAGRTAVVDGSPLELLFPSDPAIVSNLKRAGVHVVEQLAKISDTGIQELGLGGRTFKEKAVAYLERAEKGKDYHTLASRLDRMELDKQADSDKIKALEHALAEAQAKETEQRRGPGRPSNAELAARQQKETA